MIWPALLAGSLGCYLLKLAGMSVPERALEHPLLRRTTDLVPAVLLAALISVQVFAAGGAGHVHLTVDARLAGLGVAAVALVLRAPFLVVVVLAALTAALIRLL